MTPRDHAIQRLLTRLDNDYKYHPPQGTQAERYTEVRSTIGHTAAFLAKNCPESRELSCALTHLEQACFYANAAIARNE